MIKIILGISIVAFTSFCGYILSAKYRRRKEFFRQFNEFNERFLSEISYYRRPIADFIAQYSYKSEFNELLHLFYERISKEEDEEISLTEASCFHFLLNDEKSFVDNYFLMLGRGDSISQKGYFTSMKEKILSLRSEAENQSKRYGDLYVKLGFLCGLLILILII